MGGGGVVTLWRYLDDDVSLLLLGVNVGIEVGLAGLNGLLDRLDRVSALLVVTLHLPVELGLGGDVDVDTEVHLKQKPKKERLLRQYLQFMLVKEQVSCVSVGTFVLVTPVNRVPAC